MINHYLKEMNFNAIIIIFSIDNHASFVKVKSYLNMVFKYNKNPLIFLIGNKFDLKDRREVSIQEAIDFAREQNIKYFEVSSKLNFNIQNSFEEIAQDIMNKNNEEVSQQLFLEDEVKIENNKSKCGIF